eukprot:TRINITY_DN991_c0_g1_i16.p1 TRINITY_DN991_c0_g1~~TRINITY_DN991_c0_g1_i16.p1  ORF type:complete len:121 (+),score=7.08 TRINITY_DN991_c0_g1_i16:191-553(+)
MCIRDRYQRRVRETSIAPWFSDTKSTEQEEPENEEAKRCTLDLTVCKRCNRCHITEDLDVIKHGRIAATHTFHDIHTQRRRPASAHSPLESLAIINMHVVSTGDPQLSPTTPFPTAALDD